MTSFGLRCRMAAASLFLGMLAFASASAADGPAPAGRAVMAWHVTIAPAWFDPSTAPAQITPFGMLYAIHDALVRPYPGQKMGPSLAESWEESEDGKTYEFKLRAGLKFRLRKIGLEIHDDLAANAVRTRDAPDERHFFPLHSAISCQRPSRISSVTSLPSRRTSARPILAGAAPRVTGPFRAYRPLCS